jgi:hypothetical protein
MIEISTIQITRLYGFCPVQANGTVNGLPFYFHARFDTWTFAIASTPDIDPIQVAIQNAPGFRMQRKYRKRTRGKCDASFMSHAQAKVLIETTANYYLGRKER